MRHRPIPETLYHYTCEHTYRAIGDSGVLLPLGQLIPEERLFMLRRHRYLAFIIWLTDMSTPDREGLGLTSLTMTCDRTRYRYVFDDDPTLVGWWPEYVRGLPKQARELSLAPGARPAHWYIAREPVKVRLG